MRLFIWLLPHLILTKAFVASAANLETLVSVSTDRLELRVYGFNDKLPALLSKILKTTKSFMPISDRFMRLYDVDEKLHILSGLSISDVKSFIPQLWSKVYIESLCHGNLSEKEAIRLSDIFKTNFGVQPLPIELMRSEQCICLPPSANLIRDISVKNKSKTNSLQIERELRIESPRLRAVLDLFNEIVEEPLFNQLRTKEQLGCTVHCGPWVTCNTFGFYFCVQSAEDNPIYLQRRVENFINRLEELLLVNDWMMSLLRITELDQLQSYWRKIHPSIMKPIDIGYRLPIKCSVYILSACWKLCLDLSNARALNYSNKC
ncbi:putative insulysin [Rosa chinensis]|uniref:Putative insulysin n=1 Tax=Rosa chinensis TaxID=74649 RepID=A0A2P6SC68_ROSCH|nr:putative insulysin [Rosa chinensis]